jgi:hypothetical protein
MQSDRIATVCGLGVCDVLRAELAAVQRDGLARTLDARIAAAAQEQRPLLDRLRAQLPDHPEPFVLIGPAGLVLELVRDCLAGAVEALAPQLGPAWSPTLARAAETAGAWIATGLDGHAVEAYCFEPGADPAHAW